MSVNSPVTHACQDRRTHVRCVYWTPESDELTLLHLTLAARRGVEADDIFVAAVGEHLAVYALCAADGFLSGRAGGGGAVHGTFEGLADFEFVFGLLH